VQDYYQGRKPSCRLDQYIPAAFQDCDTFGSAPYFQRALDTRQAECMARHKSEKVELQDEIAQLQGENAQLRLDRIRL
jgi:hypothetical protein